MISSVDILNIISTCLDKRCVDINVDKRCVDHDPNKYFYLLFIFAGFVIFPGKNWVLQTGKYYEIQIEIFDRDSHKMFPADIPVSLLKIMANLAPLLFFVPYTIAVFGHSKTGKTAPLFALRYIFLIVFPGGPWMVKLKL